MVGIYSQLLQARYGERLDETANQYVTYCVEGARRMDELIKDLLVYARATKAGEQCTELADLNAILEASLANLRGAIEESGADVTRGPLPALCVEEIRMQQVLQNLISNAIKYRKPGEPPRIGVSADLAGDEWVFLVEDNGIGIEGEHRERIFGAFHRLHKSASSGTGLGLAICQRIVQHYGGRIWVESEPGRGSRFFFTLPARLAAPSSARASGPV